MGTLVRTPKVQDTQSWDPGPRVFFYFIFFSSSKRITLSPTWNPHHPHSSNELNVWRFGKVVSLFPRTVPFTHVHGWSTHPRGCDKGLPKEWIINNRWRNTIPDNHLALTFYKLSVCGCCTGVLINTVFPLLRYDRGDLYRHYPSTPPDPFKESKVREGQGLI